MNISRNNKAQTAMIKYKIERWDAILNVCLTMKVWTEFLIVIALIAAAGFHLGNSYIPHALIVLIVSMFVVSSILLVICSGITWLRDSLINKRN